VLLETGRARRELRWRPRHDAHETLRQTVAASSPDLRAAAEA
jgi:nucleoside-diphosphate-sugar epimerase